MNILIRSFNSVDAITFRRSTKFMSIDVGPVYLTDNSDVTLVGKYVIASRCYVPEFKKQRERSSMVNVE